MITIAFIPVIVIILIEKIVKAVTKTRKMTSTNHIQLTPY